MRTKMILAAVAAVLAVAPAAAVTSPELIKNGDFSTTTVAGNFEFDASYAAGAGGVTNWYSAGGYNMLFNAATATTTQAVGKWSGTGKEYLWAATASKVGGGNFLALDGDQTLSSVSQAVSQDLTNLVVGQSYTLSFDWGAGQLASRTGDTTEQLKVTFGGDSFFTNVLANKSQGFTGWNTVTTTFTAKSANQTLSFLSLGTPVGLPPIALLDNVSLKATGAVPEPASWAMMIVGFGAVGGAIRRSRARTAVAFA